MLADPQLRILPLEPSQTDAIVALSLRAWAPVFPAMRDEMPPYIYRSFYPQGWQVRQEADIAALCRDATVSVSVARVGDDLAGFVALKVHEEDSMGEVYAIAVDPEHQRSGVGAALLDFALDWMRKKGLAMAMVETGHDAGHAPARAAYEKAGFARLPVARYFRKL